MSDVAGELGADWHAINDAVLAYGTALHAADTNRVGAVAALGVDEVLFARLGRWRTQAWSTSIVDVATGQWSSPRFSGHLPLAAEAAREESVCRRRIPLSSSVERSSWLPNRTRWSPRWPVISGSPSPGCVVEGAFMGHSRCRFCDAQVGSLEFSDGVFIWPEGLAHYVEEHDVRLPERFVRHLRAMVEQLEDADVDDSWWQGLASPE